MPNICYIFGAGTYYNDDIPSFEKDDFIIAADGGFSFLANHGIKPDLILGDFDSLGFVPECKGSEILKLNPVKDDTDLLYAVKQGIKRNYKLFYIFGGTGGRTSHTFSNIQTLTMLAKQGLQGFLFGDNEIFTVIHNSSLNFSKKSSGNISVFSVDTVSNGVFETGLKYSINNYSMNNSFPVGVSNEFVGTDSQIKVLDGTLLVIFSKNADIIE